MIALQVSTVLSIFKPVFVTIKDVLKSFAMLRLAGIKDL